MRGAPTERTTEERLSFGVVNLDKPPGPSAHQVTGWVRDLAAAAFAAPAERASGHAGKRASGHAGKRASGHAGKRASGHAGKRASGHAGKRASGHAGIDRAAHAGTLDPKVTGCLPILLGDATRLAQVFLEGEKEYVAVLELHGPAPESLDDVLADFESDIYQKPPKKSAVARKLRVRRVSELTALEVEDRRVLLRIRCESGTYVRKLCHDLGRALGTGAHMGDLRRVGTTPFDDTDLVSMHDLTDALAFADDGDPAALLDTVQPAERALTHLPRVEIAASAAREVAEGAPVYAPGVLAVEDVPTDADEPLVACYTPDGAAVCLGRLVGDAGMESGTVVDLERVLI